MKEEVSVAQIKAAAEVAAAVVARAAMPTRWSHAQAADAAVKVFKLVLTGVKEATHDLTK